MAVVFISIFKKKKRFNVEKFKFTGTRTKSLNSTFSLLAFVGELEVLAETQIL